MQAYNELYLALCGQLLRFSAAIVSSFHLAEEVISDVFITVWQKRHQLKHVENPVVYLYVTAKNLSLNYLQQSRRHLHESLELLDTSAFQIAPDAEAGMISAEVSQKIESAIRNLPPRCQLIFRLIKHDRLSYREVADLLDISTKTVDAQLSVAIKKITAAVRLDLSGELVASYLHLDS
ncbi:RNA polymerase sigma-70 factor [Chitinophaga sp.]|uniref:RNA polymerase sigma-70 factor n=1 Tax=Chitinophaga sp. TaxID=1869181 RepID=UPI0031DA6F1B